jgi:hypothetical protein
MAGRAHQIFGSEMADRLIDWHEEAAMAGKWSRANRLLDLARTVLESYSSSDWRSRADDHPLHDRRNA